MQINKKKDECNSKKYYLVFQGQTFNQEMEKGIIWAPLANKNNRDFHHWKRLEELKEGDIIFHCCNGYLCAYSVVQEAFKKGYFPGVESNDKKYELMGRLVKCQYNYLSIPLKLSNFRSEIKKINNYVYSPFNKDGNGNQGYLYPLSAEMADFFKRKCL